MQHFVHLLKWSVDFIQSDLLTANDGQEMLALAFFATAITSKMQWLY